DGDLDLLVGNKLDPTTLRSARLFRFRNDGTAKAPAFTLADTLDMPGSYHFAPALADLTNDGLVDMLLGTWNEGVLFMRNDGTRQEPRFVQDTTRTITLTRGSNATPALVDIDDDGDLDVFIGEASGEVNFYRNVGSVSDPRFELVSDVFDGIDVGRRSHPAAVDIDDDGDADLLFGGEAPAAVLYRNEGTRAAARFVADPTFELPLHPTASPVFADVNADGVPELITGGLSGGLTLYRRQ
ncbi:MAG: FG-GAP repeat domain-containing protein, partial [Longimicrobiales bacterium]